MRDDYLFACALSHIIARLFRNGFAMGIPILSTGTHVLIGDGKKAFILFNEGTSERPSLTVETILHQPDLPTSELGADRPGRVFESVGSRRASTEETDWHQRAEDQFIRDVMTSLVDLDKRAKLRKLVLVAPPRAMAELRRVLPSSFASLVTAEIAKDLTNHSVTAITELLQAEEPLF